MIIKGGDKVLLKNGQIVEVADLKLNHIMVAFDEWYPISDVVEIIETQKKKKSWWTWWKKKTSKKTKALKTMSKICDEFMGFAKAGDISKANQAIKYLQIELNRYKSKKYE